MILIDAGPLVALLSRDDRHHKECSEAIRGIREPLGTVWPAIAEAMHLLAFSWDAQDKLWKLLESGSIQILEIGTEDFPRLRELMRKYRSLPMDLADAGLVRSAEKFHVSRILTLDRRDFGVYRARRVGPFTILP